MLPSYTGWLDNVQATHSSITIRRARPEDAHDMLVVHRDAVFARASSHYSTATMEAWSPGATPARVGRITSEISDSEFIVLVAEADDEVIGFAEAIPSKQELRAVYVRPNSVGQVGRWLLAELEELASKVTDTLTCTASLNAEAFYRACGYSGEEHCDVVFRPGVTLACVQLQKSIANFDHER